MSEPRTQGGVKSPSVNQKSRAEYVRPVVKIRDNKHATEAGMSDAEIKTLFAEEERFLKASKGGKYEVAGVIDESGALNPRGNPMVKGYSRRPRTQADVAKALQEVTHGTQTKVNVRRDRVPENSIYTHYHPWTTLAGTGLGSRVGVSFSGTDLRSAAKMNNKTIRARTENYVFALHRPKGGWPDGDAMQASWNRANNRVVKELRDWINRQNFTPEERSVRWGRLNAIASHQATKEVAKEYGLHYTRKRVR